MIDEIVNNLQRIADRKCYPEDVLDGSIAQEWVDYIVDLQQENKQLKEEIENIKDFNNKLQASKDRLDKDDYNLAHILTELEEHCEVMLRIFEKMSEEQKQEQLDKYVIYDKFLGKIQELKEKYKC